MVHGIKIDPYDDFLFVAVGRRYSQIRSIGHKAERAALTRLLQATRVALSMYGQEDQRRLAIFLHQQKPLLPVAVTKEEQLFPNLIRPELFLWQTHDPARGLPIDSNYFYASMYASLSAAELTKHIEQVITDYMFCARLQEHTREIWLDRIAVAYKSHPFIQFAHAHQQVVQDVERMNRSSLLSVLNYPEDVAFWRHRVEIVMRPYREIPKNWRWTMCNHEKDLSFLSATSSVRCSCKLCDFSMLFDVSEQKVLLPEEPDMERTRKRIVTIERLVNEMAERSGHVMKSLTALQHVKRQIEPFASDLDELLLLADKLNVDEPIWLKAFRAMQNVTVPKQSASPTLSYLAAWDIPDVRVLKDVHDWVGIKIGASDVQEVSLAWKELEESQKPKAGDLFFEQEGFVCTYGEREAVVQFLQEVEVRLTFRLIVQFLRGEATNKVRTLTLHERPLFGLFSSWPEKVVVKLVKELKVM